MRPLAGAPAVYGPPGRDGGPEARRVDALPCLDLRCGVRGPVYNGKANELCATHGPDTGAVGWRHFVDGFVELDGVAPERATPDQIMGGLGDRPLGAQLRTRVGQFYLTDG